MLHRLFIVLSLFCMVTTPVVANNKREQKLDDVKSQINAIQQVLAKQIKDESTSQSELKRLEKALAKTQLNLKRHDKKIKANTRKLSGLQKESGQLQEVINLQQTYLKQQLRSAYLIGQQGQLQLLLNQHESASVGRMLTYYQYLNTARSNEISSAQANIDKLATLRETISIEKRSLQAQRKERAAELSALSSQFKDREAFLQALRKSMQGQKNQLSSLEKDKRRITTLINSLETVIDDIPLRPPAQTVFSQQKGKLPWPIKGKVKHPFGSLRAGQDLRWQGLFINSANGKSVNAVASGHIVFADWLAGFGLLIIIDHQDNYMSLYAHNSVLFAELGDWVDAYQTIGETGQTGGIKETGLYFEIRKGGTPIDPKTWLAKR